MVIIIKGDGDFITIDGSDAIYDVNDRYVALEEIGSKIDPLEHWIKNCFLDQKLIQETLLALLFQWTMVFTKLVRLAGGSNNCMPETKSNRVPRILSKLRMCLIKKLMNYILDLEIQYHIYVVADFVFQPIT